MKEDKDATAITSGTKTPKKRSTPSIFRAAILALRRRRSSSSKKGPVIGADAVLKPPTAADDVLKSLVGGMRPLRLQLECHPPLPLAPPPPARHESFHDVCLPPPSPACSSGDGMSRYASAEDLQVLNMTEEGDGGADEEADEGGAPNAIDMKAEEFIAKFYEQIRLQRQLDSEAAEEVAS